MLGAAQAALLGACQTVHATYVARVLAYAPDWYLPLSESSGSTAAALLGASGTYANGPQLGIDPIALDDPGGKSIGLSGATIDTPHVAVTSPLTGPDLTIDMIVQLDDLTRAKHVLITTTGGSIDGQFSVEVLTNGQVRAWSVAEGTARIFLGRAGDVPQGEAVKITYQRKSSVGWSQRIYVDGVVKAEDPNPRTWAAVPAGTVYIGTWRIGSVFLDPTDGLIAHVAGWNRLLSLAQIQDLVRVQSAAWAGNIDAGAMQQGATKQISVLQGGWHGKIPVTASAGNGSLVTTTESGDQITVTAGVVTGNDDTFSYSFTDANGNTTATKTVTIDVTTAAPAGVTAASVAAFGHSVQDVTALSGWPAGRTPDRVVIQGEFAHGYVRRSWKPNNNNGHYMDFQAGWRQTLTPDTIVVALDDGSMVNIALSVTQSIPSPGPGGTTRTLDAAGGGDYTDWNTAIAALRANDVLVVRAPAGNFVYTQDNNGSGPTSTVDGVTIVAHPGDLAAGRRPRIHVKGSVFKCYADNLNSGRWEVYQDLGSPHGKVWRTTATVGTLVNIGCSYRTAGGGLRRCFTYTNTSGTPGALARLTDTTYPRVQVDQPDVPSEWSLYMGPGIYLHSDNKLYIRLTPLTDGIGALQVDESQGAGYPNPPWDWSEDGPANQDPNQCQLFISSSNDSGTIGVTTNTSYVLRINSTSNWTLENLDFVGGGDTIQMRSGNGHTIRGCRFLGWAPPYMPDSTTQDTIQRRHNMFAAVSTFTLTCERCEFWGGTPPWVGWSDNKGQMGAYSLAAAAATLWFMQASSDATVSFSGTFRNCLLDGWVTATKPGGTPQFIKFHNCSMRYWGLDGAIVTQNPTETIDHIRCQLFQSSSLGWISTTARGAQYWGYNLICNFRPFMHYWAFWTINSRSAPNEFVCGTTVTAHGGSSWRDCLEHYHYNNTSIGAHNHRRMSAIANKGGSNAGVANDGCGAATGTLPFEQNAYYKTYYARNNVMAVRPNNSQGTSANGPGGPSGDSHVAVLLHPTHIGFGQGATVTYTVDYNIYHRGSGMPTLSGANKNGVITTVNNSRTETARNLIADVQSDTGQEAHGRIADPLFAGTWAATKLDSELHANAFWCLQAQSPAVSGGDTTNRSWPDVDFGTEITYGGQCVAGLHGPECVGGRAAGWAARADALWALIGQPNGQPGAGRFGCLTGESR